MCFNQNSICLDPRVNSKVPEGILALNSEAYYTDQRPHLYALLAPHNGINFIGIYMVHMR